MFEKFTPLAKRAISRAQDEAVNLGHGFIGTAHILLGLADVTEGIAAAVLAAHDVTPERARSEMTRLPQAAGITATGARAATDALAAIGIDVEDSGPFRALTQHVFEAFPAFPPFEGQFADVVPHLTIGHGHPLDDLRAAEESVRAHLPIDGHAAVVTLMTQQPAVGHWTEAARFPLASV